MIYLRASYSEKCLTQLHVEFLYLASIERKRHPFKCLTFGATSLENRQPATGDFDGNINLWDVENKQPGTSYI